MFDIKSVCVCCSQKVKDYKYLSRTTQRIYDSPNAMEEHEGRRDGNWDVICADCAEKEQFKEANFTSRRLVSLASTLIVTTTPNVEGLRISEYKGIVTSQVFMGVNIFRDLFGGMRDIVGGRSMALEQEMEKAKNMLISELKGEAIKLGANAVIGLKVDFEEVGKAGTAFMLLGIGTAVVLEDKQGISA